MIRRLLVYRGRFRAWLGICPKCNFDPVLEPTCTICGGNCRDGYATDETAKNWAQLYEAELKLRKHPDN